MLGMSTLLCLKAVLSSSQSASGSTGELFIAMGSPVPACALTIPCLHSYMPCLRFYFSRPLLSYPVCTSLDNIVVLES